MRTFAIPHDEARPAFRRIFVMYAAVMQHHDVMNDCETETGAAIHTGFALTVAAEESFEQIGLLCVRYARPIVLDDDLRHTQFVDHGLRHRYGNPAAIEA